ncbi:MAG: tyrosine-type recombinase/integrase [Bacteroidetes bacterium]|nr:tyrosine-type recombinase/integrase [Bacteroidota bacterium]
MSSIQEKLIRDFLNHLQYQKRFSPNTLIAYKNDLSVFFNFVEKEYTPVLLKDIKPAFIRSWLATLRENEITAKSINRKISALKSFFKFYMAEGLVDKNPLTSVISPKTNKQLPVFLDEKATDYLFQQIEFPNTFKGKTDHLIIALLYETGMRLSELTGLQELNVDAYHTSVKVLGKRNKERIIPISKNLLNEITQYIAEKNLQSLQNQYVLVTEKGKPLYPKYVYNIVKHYLSLSTTIRKKSPHVLRHTFATQVLNNGASLNDVKELLGHSSLAATQVYTHNSIEKLKEAFSRAHPKA